MPTVFFFALMCMMLEPNPQPPHSMPAPPPPPLPALVCALDKVALAKLHELDPQGRLGVVQRVLQAFETSLMRTLAQLQAQGALDAALVSHIAHTLKSSSASVGASRLAAVCADTERHCRAGDSNALAPDVQRLLSEGGATLVAVRAMLHNRTAAP